MATFHTASDLHWLYLAKTIKIIAAKEKLEIVNGVALIQE